MTKTRTFVLAVALCAAWPAYAMWSVVDRGAWPKTWPPELEPLRQQSRTYTGGVNNVTRYEIPFAKRADFESTWPHILKVKTAGSPIVLYRGPHTQQDTLKAGVRIQCPPPQAGKPNTPAGPIRGLQDVVQRWAQTTFIELVVDGDIVDLNRIPLPADTPIIDQRFEDAKDK